MQIVRIRMFIELGHLPMSVGTETDRAEDNGEIVDRQTD